MFFFKQNTAYEMRISDWSSDVCSSDLGGTGAGTFARRQDQGPQVQGERALSQTDRLQAALALLESIVADRNVLAELPADERTRLLQARSEEHTSELQYLMSISYAVFCLKKNMISHLTHQTHINHRH